jgi:hypothetical protein
MGILKEMLETVDEVLSQIFFFGMFSCLFNL